MSLSGYSKIERDETDISIKRLQQIAKVLDAHYQQILEFDDKGIFNITQNQHAEGVQHAYTVVKNQQNISNKESEKIIQHLMSENTYLRELLNKNLQTKSS